MNSSTSLPTIPKLNRVPDMETLAKYPALLNGKGPHGFTLLHHASKGGEASKELYEFFLEQGLKETQFKIK